MPEVLIPLSRLELAKVSILGLSLDHAPDRPRRHHCRRDVPRKERLLVLEDGFPLLWCLHQLVPYFMEVLDCLTLRDIALVIPVAEIRLSKQREVSAHRGLRHLLRKPAFAKHRASALTGFFA